MTGTILEQQQLSVSSHCSSQCNKSQLKVLHKTAPEISVRQKMSLRNHFVPKSKLSFTDAL